MLIQEEKAALRRELLAQRRAIEDREGKDREIFRHITALALWQQAQRVYLYLSAKGEPDTFALARAALDAGKEVCAPVSGEEGRMEFYVFHSLDDLRPGRWGIQEPDPLRCQAAGESTGKEVCLVPGLAFDWQGNRLGYGKGYYDRFLAAREIEPVGVCYEAFWLRSLPAGCKDKRVGRVATEAGVHVCAREGSKL